MRVASEGRRLASIWLSNICHRHSCTVVHRALPHPDKASANQCLSADAAQVMIGAGQHNVCTNFLEGLDLFSDSISGTASRSLSAAMVPNAHVII